MTDILTVNDYYLDYVQGDKIKIQPGLYLLSAKLDWIFGGRTKDLGFDVNQSNMLVLTYVSNINKSHTFAEVHGSCTIDKKYFWNIDSQTDKIGIYYSYGKLQKHH